MSRIPVEKVEAPKALGLLDDLDRRLADVRQRAFDLFELRGGRPGHDLDDWLAAERELLGLPTAELKDARTAFEMDVALPGFAAKDVDVKASPSEIFVHAASRTRSSDRQGEVLWSEFSRREIFRRFPLPQTIDEDHITAELDNGVLHVTAPKSPAIASPGR